MAAEHTTRPERPGVERLAAAISKRELRRVLDEAGVRCSSGANKYAG